MSNVYDELSKILKPWEDELVSEYGSGIDDNKKAVFIEFEKAKLAIINLLEQEYQKGFNDYILIKDLFDKQIEQVDIKARIDEWSLISETIHASNIVSEQYVNNYRLERLKELEEK